MTSPTPDTDARMSRRTLWIVLGAAGGVLLLCGGLWILGTLTPAGKPGAHAGPSATTVAQRSQTTPPSPTASGLPPAATTRAAAPPPSSSAPDRMICRVDTGDGSYYLNVTSARDHNFHACDGATPYSGTVDDLLRLPGMDRRCILPDSYTEREHAIVGVYSGTGRDLAAARAFCDANGGTQ